MSFNQRPWRPDTTAGRDERDWHRGNSPSRCGHDSPWHDEGNVEVTKLSGNDWCWGTRATKKLEHAR